MPMLKCETCDEDYFDWDADRHQCGERFFVHLVDEDDGDTYTPIHEMPWLEQWAVDPEEAAARAWKHHEESNESGIECVSLGRVVVAVGGNPAVDLVDGSQVKLKVFTAESYVARHYRSSISIDWPVWVIRANRLHRLN
jgi:hypothetical protein